MKKILIILLTIVLYSCSSNSKEKSETFIGSFELAYTETESGDPIGKEYMEQLRSLGYNVTLELYKDGTGELNFFDEKTILEYDPSKSTMKANDQVIKYELNDDYLILYQQNDTLYFVSKKQ